MKQEFDIIVVGGGHAGVEAAYIASQFPIKVALVTLPEVSIASAPCNPAVGGVGKGQVVREIDVLGGLMGRLADLAAIQYRTLNQSKGYAVQSTRVQIDKMVYSEQATQILQSLPNLKIIRDHVFRVARLDSDEKFIIECQNDLYTCSKLIITTGTFLNGQLHTGSQMTKGGRVGCPTANSLNNLLQNIQSLPVRFKTGTPPRLLKQSINFAAMEIQESDPQTPNFHILHQPFQRKMPQAACYITRTSEETLKIIRENKANSPIFNGQIQGIGPRYCPSIEDKAHRYPDRSSHHIFIEPEGLQLNTIYPNGISTSLPIEIQKKFLQTIPGLENSEIVIPGYAVEYDVMDTTKLDKCLAHKFISGLYFAGQINGTSGYEEAAGQGIIAGLNAALSVLGRPPLIICRNDSYIGVMIADLVSNCRDEPYRLFTARAENRLYIREDNVVNRMYPYRLQLGLKSELDSYLQNYIREYEILLALINKKTYSPTSYHLKRFEDFSYGKLGEHGTTLHDLLKLAHLDPISTLEKECEWFKVAFMPRVIRAAAIENRYEGYISRSLEQNEKIRKLDHVGINWQRLTQSPTIANECRQRIEKIRPTTFGDLRNIEGIRPATLAIVAGMMS